MKSAWLRTAVPDPPIVRRPSCPSTLGCGRGLTRPVVLRNPQRRRAGQNCAKDAAACATYPPRPRKHDPTRREPRPPGRHDPTRREPRRPGRHDPTWREPRPPGRNKSHPARTAPTRPKQNPTRREPRRPGRNKIPPGANRADPAETKSHPARNRADPAETKSHPSRNRADSAGPPAPLRALATEEQRAQSCEGSLLDPLRLPATRLHAHRAGLGGFPAGGRTLSYSQR